MAITAVGTHIEHLPVDGSFYVKGRTKTLRQVRPQANTGSGNPPMEPLQQFSLEKRPDSAQHEEQYFVRVMESFEGDRED